MERDEFTFGEKQHKSKNIQLQLLPSLKHSHDLTEVVFVELSKNTRMPGSFKKPVI